MSFIPFTGPDHPGHACGALICFLRKALNPQRPHGCSLIKKEADVTLRSGFRQGTFQGYQCQGRLALCFQCEGLQHEDLVGASFACGCLRSFEQALKQVLCLLDRLFFRQDAVLGNEKTRQGEVLKFP